MSDNPPKTTSQTRTAQWVHDSAQIQSDNKEVQKITERELQRLRQIVTQHKTGLHISDTGYVI